MYPLFQWLLHSESLGVRLLLALSAGVFYVGGGDPTPAMGPWPEAVKWWACLAGVMLTAATVKAVNGAAHKEE